MCSVAWPAEGWGGKVGNGIGVLGGVVYYGFEHFVCVCMYLYCI